LECGGTKIEHHIADEVYNKKQHQQSAGKSHDELFTERGIGEISEPTHSFSPFFKFKKWNC